MILWADGMGWYDSSESGISKHYTTGVYGAGSSITVVSSGGGRNAPAINCYEGTSAGSYARFSRAITGSKDTITIGARFKFTDTSPGNGNYIIQFMDGATVDVELVQINGQLVVHLNGPNTYTYSSRALLFPSEHYIEMKVYKSNTVGTVEVRVDGEVWHALTGKDTLNASTAYIASIRLGPLVYTSSGNGASIYINDLYITDETAPNAGFLGEVRVDTLFPDGEGNYKALTPSPAVSRNLNVDDSSSDEANTVNTAAISSATKDTYTIGDMTYTPSAIKAVSLHIMGAKDAAGAAYLRPVCRVSSSDYFGTSTALSGVDSYTEFFKVWDNNPNTSAAWANAAAVNGVELGVEVV